MTFADLNITIPRNARGNIKTKCPQCAHSHSKGKQSAKDLSVHVEEGIWRCHRCSWSGKLAQDAPKKDYFVPKEISLPVDDNIAEWFAKRGISKNTLLRFKISQKKEYMPQAGKERKCIVFPYFRNEKIVNHKYRDPQKNFKMEKGAELTIFNLDAVDGQKEIMIVEGEPDCMAVYESGYFTVCSVPNGASVSSNAKLEYLDNCSDAFRNAEKIIIATDGDEPGIALRDEIARRLGKYRCFQFGYPEGCKDANEILVKHGPEKLKETIDGCKPFPVEGIFTITDFEEDLDEVYQHGFPKGAAIGYDEFDKLLTFREGELTTWTGIPGSGKSTFLDQAINRLAVRHGWKFGVCSFENQPATVHAMKLSECFIGKPFYRTDPKNKMSEHEYSLAKKYIGEHFYFYKMREVDTTVDGIIEKAKEAVLRFGIKGLVVDPYNKIEHRRSNGLTETEYVAEVLNKLKRFAEDYEVHVFLVAHPTKMQKDKTTGEYEVPNLYSIAGSAHFYNITDNGVVVHRSRKNNTTLVAVLKVRFFFIGKEGTAEFTFDAPTKRFAEINCGYEIEAVRYLDRIGQGQGEFDFTPEPAPAAPLPLSRNFDEDEEIDEVPF